MAAQASFVFPHVNMITLALALMYRDDTRDAFGRPSSPELNPILDVWNVLGSDAAALSPPLQNLDA